MSQAFRHRPVMVDQVVATLVHAPAGLLVDSTVGGGGHAAAVLEAAPHLDLLGIDRDTDALAAATERLSGFGPRVRLHHGRNDCIGEVLDDLGVAQISGALFDLGVSSPQLDRADRGFSYRADAPLDMRMDRSQPMTAADLVNTASAASLAELFAANGEGRFAGRIARAVVGARPLTTTAQLADVVRDAIPAATRRTGGHPAKRVFQALRIAVNRELELLPTAVDGAIDRLAGGGRMVVLSYHSGEDRIVKERFLAAESGGCTCAPGLPVASAGEACRCGAVGGVRLLHRGARKASADEIAANPRAESARFRSLEKLALPADRAED